MRVIALRLALLAAAAGASGCHGHAPAASAATPAPDGPAAAGGCAHPGVGPEPDAKQVAAFVRGRQGTFKACYERHLKVNPNIQGRFTLRFAISRCGEVEEVEAVDRRGDIAEVAACSAAEARGWQTPFRPAEPVTIEWPFVFAPAR
ncbi:MAG TPA: AgmX/PglI C-terminal domain-containing protein [Anaeromyxobacteraceae bacterium]|nr:AgmX/PglI C-terminal domain-containing protein [Anaeromyxobacteraceae bacterium]